MRSGMVAVVFALAFSMQGCASTSEMEARQLAYDGSSQGMNPCLMGGVTEKAQQHCQALRWKDDGVLMSINRKATEQLPEDNKAHPCQVHVKRLEEALEDHPEFTHQRLYSCPIKNNPGGSCHVSLLVYDQEGHSYVLDNGAVLRDSQYPASVGSLNDFANEIGTVYWIGYIPEDARQVALSSFGNF